MFWPFISEGRWGSLLSASLLRWGHYAMGIPLVRDKLVGLLIDRLATSYESTDLGPTQLSHVQWLGRRLAPFLRRLLAERPAAAQAILRFIGTWATDMYRRTDGQKAGRACPATVVIDPTDRCNLCCPGCYAKSGAGGSDLSFEHLVQIVRQTIDMGVSLITLTGGEPFLRERQDRTVTRLAGMFPRQGFLVYTNGTLIDEPTAAAMGGVGNIFPAISVEGFEHQTDARRGRGVYERNRAVRQMLARRGVMTGFSATVTRENAESICSDAFIELRMAEGDLFGWFFILQPIGRSPRLDLMVSADQRAMLRETVYRWRDEGRPIFLGDFWNDGHLTNGCIAGGKYYFHIYANGDISPCVFAPVSCGNVLDILEGRSEYKSLAEFVEFSPVFRAFREQQLHVTDRNRPCLLIDHPDMFRQIARLADCRAAKNMPPNYLAGSAARAIDAVAAEWAEKVPHLPPLPAERHARAAAEGAAREAAVSEVGARGG